MAFTENERGAGPNTIVAAAVRVLARLARPSRRHRGREGKCACHAAL